MLHLSHFSRFDDASLSESFDAGIDDYKKTHCSFRGTKNQIIASENCYRILLCTQSTVQNPSREANWFAASQEIPRISRNSKVHYRTHKCPPTVYHWPAQSSPYTTSHLLEIHPNIIHPSTYLLTYLLHGAESFLRS